MAAVLILLGIAVLFFYLSSSASKKQAQKIHGTGSGPSNINQSGGYGKWIGGGLGWALGGPIGGLLGFMFGSMFEGKSNGTTYQTHPYTSGQETQSGDFSASLLVLAAAVMKADGVVKKSELDYVKRFLEHNFGQQKTAQLLLVLRELLNKDINIQEVSTQIRYAMDFSSRLQLLHFLFGIAGADKAFSDTEIRTIQDIAGYMNISNADFNSVKAMFVKDLDSAYTILEISSHATNDEVKKAYHKMAIKYHPDKVSHLGEEVQKAAEEKFQKLNAAYEEIKKRRGIV